MTTRLGGYDYSRFPIAPDDNLQCPICMNVLKEPVQCRRNQHDFCRSCITRILEDNSHQTCPVCQEHLTVETLAQPSRLLTNLLFALKIRCDYFNRGCTELIELEFLNSHVVNCGYSPVLCGNDGCLKNINKQDKEHHETELCEFRVWRCHDCDKDLLYKKKETHGCNLKKEVDKIKINLVEIKDELRIVKNQMQCNQERVMKGFREMMVEMTEMTHNLRTQVIEFNGGTKHMQNDALGLLRHKTKADILVAGGFDGKSPLSSVEMLSWVKRVWVPLESMQEQRFAASSFVYQQQMFVAGGRNGRHALDTMERIQLNQKPRKLSDFSPKLPFKARGHSSVVYKNQLIFIGGYNDDEGSVSDGIYEILLIPPYSMKLLCRMSQPRWRHGSELIDHKIIIAGGTTTRHVEDCLASVVLYDIINNNFKEMPPLPFPMSGMSTVLWKGNTILFGGIDNSDRVLNTAIKYDVKTGKHEMLPPIKHNRFGCAAIITESTVVVMGGYNNQEKSTNYVEYFDWGRFKWEDLPPMRGKRHFLSAAVMHDTWKF